MDLCNIESERSVLATIMTEPQYAPDLLRVIGDNPKVFYLAFHQQVYQAILNNLKSSKPIDPVSVGVELQRMGIKNFAIPLYEIVQELVAPENAKYHARVVLEMYKRRKLLHSASMLISALKEGDDPDEAAQRFIDQWSELQTRDEDNSVKSIAKDMMKLLDFRASGELMGIPSGFALYDETLGGFSRGEFVIIAGRPSHGKTALMLNYAVNIAQAGYRVALISLEMDKMLIYELMLAMLSKVPINTLKAGSMNDEQWASVSEANERLAQLQIDIIEDAVDPFDVEIALKRGEYDICFLDYIQLMKAGSRFHYTDRNAELTEISRHLKRIAISLGIPLIVLSQLNRAIEGRAEKEFLLSDLRDSGSLEQDADVIMFIKRPYLFGEKEYRTDPATTKLTVKKNRNGPSNVEFTLHFMPSIMKFIEKGVNRGYQRNAGADDEELAIF